MLQPPATTQPSAGPSPLTIYKYKYYDVFVCGITYYIPSPEVISMWVSESAIVSPPESYRSADGGNNRSKPDLVSKVIPVANLGTLCVHGDKYQVEAREIRYESIEGAST
jgi:hypothetical protein